MLARTNGNWANTFIAGVPKGGTTALAAILAQHPEVFVPRKKEPRYYYFKDEEISPSNKVNRNVITKAEHYAALYAGASEKVLVDASPSYYGSEKALSLIRQDVPGARLILLLRDPVERTFSHFWFAVQRGYEPPGSKFEDIFTAGEVDAGGGYVRRRNYLKSSVYVERLDALFKIFPRGQVYMTTSERFMFEQATVLSEICEFLEIGRYDFDLGVGEKAKSGLPKSRLVHALTRNAQRVMKLAPGLIPRHVREGVDRAHNSNLVKPQMLPGTRRRLVDYYRDSVSELARKHQVDVSHWRNFSGATREFQFNDDRV
ncbi:MAG TPA: sulfotransferase [Pyrinomonadaceae bacterium]|nr:sulfotransferase [Pyrinomonadaceae bacterium]